MGQSAVPWELGDFPVPLRGHGAGGSPSCSTWRAVDRTRVRVTTHYFIFRDKPGKAQFKLQFVYIRLGKKFALSHHKKDVIEGWKPFV